MPSVFSNTKCILDYTGKNIEFWDHLSTKMELDQTVSLCVWLHAAMEGFPSNFYQLNLIHDKGYWKTFKPHIKKTNKHCLTFSFNV